MSSSGEFEYRTRVAFYETDAMAVVHHSNYLRYFEEARVQWLSAHGLDTYHFPDNNMTLAVLETTCQHHRALHFNDEIVVRLQLKVEGLKISFRYAIYSPRHGDEVVATGTSRHVPIKTDTLRPCRLPKPILAAMEKEKWTETWP